MEQPKKPPSGYWLFLGEHREAIVKELGTGKGSDVAKKGGEMWKATGEDERKPYEEKAAKLKAEYGAALQAFKVDGGVVARKSKKDKPEKTAKKDPDAPKRPVGGGYGVYLAEHREEIKQSLPADHKITDVSKAAGAKWKALPETEKEQYQVKYTEKKAGYAKAMEEYTALHPEPAVEEDAQSPPAKVSKRQATDDTEKKEPKPKKIKVVKQSKAEKKLLDEVDIDENVLAEARNAELEGALKNLANRPEIKALGLQADKLLSTLKANNGLVNPTKHALLGRRVKL